MLFIELVALLTALGVTGVSITSVVAFIKRRGVKVDQAIEAAARAIQSGDFRQIDGVLVLYANALPKDVKKKLEERRTELFLEANP
jgi:hypothetical protein